MLTASKLKELGFEQRDAYMIMQRLRLLKCNVSTVKLRSTYVRNGQVCDYTNFCDSVNLGEAIVALGKYISNAKNTANIVKWKQVLDILFDISGDRIPA